MIRTRTLSDLASQQALYAHCIDCRRWHKLNLTKIINRNGDLAFDTLLARLRCKECGGKEVEFNCVWEGNARELKIPRL